MLSEVLVVTAQHVGLVGVSFSMIFLHVYCILMKQFVKKLLLFAVTDGTVQYEGTGVELAFPHLDQSDPLLVLQLQHRYTAVCLALKHTLRYNTHTHKPLMEKSNFLKGQFTQITTLIALKCHLWCSQYDT